MKFSPKRLAARAFYRVLWGIGFLVRLLPFTARKAIAHLAALVLYHGVGFRKAVVLHNLAHVFPREHAESMQDFRRRCETIAFKNYVHYMLCILEIFERFHWTEADMATRVRVFGREVGDRFTAEKRGFFFLTAHLGNWELLTRIGKFLRLDLAILTKYLRNSFADELWVRSRASYGLELLEEEGSGLKVVRAIRNGKAVGFILDQHTGSPHGIEARFLGPTAWCPKGLAILASRLRAPVVPAYLVRLADGSFETHIEEPLDFSPIYDDPRLWDGKQLTDEGLRTHVEACNRHIERYVRRYPDQYLWLHKRYKGRLDYRSKLPWQL